MLENTELEYIYIPVVEEIADNFLKKNEKIYCLVARNLKKVGSSFLSSNRIISKIELPLLEKINYHFLFSCFNIDKFNFLCLDESGKTILKGEHNLKVTNEMTNHENTIYNVGIMEVRKESFVRKFINKILKKDENLPNKIK